MNDFDGLVAVVTGGASGIGAATAAQLRDRGARVAVLDRSYTAVAGTAMLEVPCDVSDSASVIAAIGVVADTLGAVDVVINNAGIGAVGDATQNDDAEWHRVLDVNVVGIARMTRAALPFLLQSSHPAIVNTCSAVASVGVPQRALYSASKGAVHGLTLAMAADHVAQGIRVNAVTPGTADTPWVGRLLDRAPDPVLAAAALRARQPLGRLVTADEIAFAIAYLASPLSGSTTGTILAVDGGMASIRVG
jgi:NAD(P)-dependent dehydrogenase (short-subunit alcohol dehydrogenase family)